MATMTERFFTWIFLLGEPSQGDINWLFEHDMIAYVLVDFAWAGEC